MGITQQRLIDLKDVALDYEQALTELMRRIKLQLEQDPENFRLQILSSITPLDLLRNPTGPITLARESENIRLTRAHNDQRRNLAKRRLAEAAPPTIPKIEDSWSLDQLSSILGKHEEEK
jgi:hypothetical protein